jgi:hypothetical protein
VELREGGSFIGTYLASPDSNIGLEQDATLIGALYDKNIDLKERVQLAGTQTLYLIFGTVP